MEAAEYGETIDADAALLVKRDGLYEQAEATFDLERGKVWLRVTGEETGMAPETLCVEASRLRALVAAYDAALAASGLSARTDDGYAR